MNNKRLDFGSYEVKRDGVPLKYKITTVPDHLAEAVVDHMTIHFLPREPMCSSFKFHEDPASTEDIRDIWRKCISGGVSLVAIRDGPEDEKERIIGANITYIKNKDDTKPENMDGPLKKVYDAVVDIAEKAKIFERYDVNKYLTAFGLSVDGSYERYKVGEHLLLSRKPLCKALGIKVTGTVFTHVKSMYLSKKVGFIVLYEEEYSKYIYNGEIIFKGLPGKFEQSAWVFT